MNKDKTAALKEFAEKWWYSSSMLIDDFTEGLTALINEHYVPKEQHGIIVATADRLLLEVKELREMKECRTCNELGHTCWLHDPTNPDNKKEDAGYPKEFVEWCIENIAFSPIKYRDRNGKIFLNIAEIFEWWGSLQRQPQPTESAEHCETCGTCKWQHAKYEYKCEDCRAGKNNYEPDEPTAEGAEEILARGKLLMFGHVIVDPIMLPEGIYATKELRIYQPDTTIEHLIEIGKSFRDKTQTRWLPDSYFDNLSKCELRDVVVYAALTADKIVEGKIREELIKFGEHCKGWARAYIEIFVDEYLENRSHVAVATADSLGEQLREQLGEDVGYPKEFLRYCIDHAEIESLEDTYLIDNTTRYYCMDDLYLWWKENVR